MSFLFFKDLLFLDMFGHAKRCFSRLLKQIQVFLLAFWDVDRDLPKRNTLEILTTRGTSCRFETSCETRVDPIVPLERHQRNTKF